MENCKHDRSAPKEVVRNLPLSQAGEGRHKCAVCAYAVGYQQGLVKGREQKLQERLG